MAAICRPAAQPSLRWWTTLRSRSSQSHTEPGEERSGLLRRKGQILVAQLDQLFVGSHPVQPKVRIGRLARTSCREAGRHSSNKVRVSAPAAPVRWKSSITST